MGVSTYANTEWTELGQDNGLDPLAMLRPTEALYQSLLPGISTVTLRLRYYSFFAWMLQVWARGGSTSPQEFQLFQRKAEVIFALVGVSGDYETGLAGSTWAHQAWESGRDPINISEIADPAAAKRYLQNSRGAYGAIYASQMKESGLVASAANHSLDVLTGRGVELADAFESDMAPALNIFIDALRKGQITRNQIQELQVLKPSAVPDKGRERVLLQRLLVGPQDNETESDIARALTMNLILKTTSEVGKRPSPAQLKWHWYREAHALVTGKNGGTQVLKLWGLYHANDLLRLSYELLLKRALNILQMLPTKGCSTSRLISLICDDIDSPETHWEKFVSDLPQPAATAIEEELTVALERQGASKAATDDKTVNNCLKLLAMAYKYGVNASELVSASFPTATPFQSLSTEIPYLQALNGISLESITSRLVRDRILMRHLWVAAKKLRKQKAYTYLFDIDDGSLRFRDGFVASLSNPRLSQAMTFLDDAGLLAGEYGSVQHNRVNELR